MRVENMLIFKILQFLRKNHFQRLLKKIVLLHYEITILNYFYFFKKHMSYASKE